MRYVKAIPGPRIDQPFRVLSGFAAIQGFERGSITVPAGGCWPGTPHLPAWVLDELQPTGSTLVPGTRISTEGCQPLLPSGEALVVAQLLRSTRNLRHRLTLADHLFTHSLLNRDTLGAIMGVRRESIKERSKPKQAAP